MPKEMLQKLWQPVQAYAAHPDQMVANCNMIALIVASNQPFYPLYVYWAVSDTMWPTFFTFLSTPFFLAVPWLGRRSPLLGRALLPLTGIANTVVSAKAFGPESGVEIFLIPCALIAAMFFRASERWVSFPLVALALGVYLGIGGTYGAPPHLYSETEYAAFARLNALSASTLTVFLGLIAAGLISRKSDV